MAGMSWNLGRDVPDFEKLYARKLWADFRTLQIATAMNSKTLRRVLRNACFFFRKKRQENGVQIVKNYGGGKILQIRAPYYF